ncbi:hypothetical protein DTO013E5_2118 [Penicillium roqueforti]|uniref:Genomic scaffold, ProqFM164S02 n=1 Tax=Penicillium roqueforti (strain FM164) TaxID=1365484 RepID=W6QPW2_PENRF|nr:hypothetical protein DTO012A1_7167 [Penicillium roqueforti]CDM31607.1 unnamed protein product [Penicillium roqueforti FM164]KAI2748610.1 hypothetical protein DTO013F2_6346 [Penicillium roqueforti]KAI2752268.1 hypothetical protein DTO006G1_9335 [Penicillium roqueforti]KAI2766645.1 hypothetical protein DTO012A8_8146 [Penicillium roqueforti]
MAETHLTIRAIYEEIDRTKRNDPDATIYGVWNSILALQFPCSAGYVTRFHGENELLFHTYHYMDFKTIPTNFLVVQCKRQSLQARPSGWEEGVNQLTQYLSDTHGKRPIWLRRPVYSFVAIGKLMRVFKYDDENECVLNWGLPGYPSGNIYHLVDDDVLFQQILDYIRANH